MERGLYVSKTWDLGYKVTLAVVRNSIDQQGGVIGVKVQKSKDGTSSFIVFYAVGRNGNKVMGSS